jgi:hypothetical protein
MKIKFLLLFCTILLLIGCGAAKPTPIPTTDPEVLLASVPPVNKLVPEKLLDYTLNKELSRPTALTFIYVNAKGEPLILQLGVQISVKQASRKYAKPDVVIVNDLQGIATPNLYGFDGASYSVFFNKYYYLFETTIQAQDKSEVVEKREKVIAFSKALTEYLYLYP